MIIGKISENEKTVKFDVEIHCINCDKKVPGGLKTGEKYYQTKPFKIESCHLNPKNISEQDAFIL